MKKKLEYKGYKGNLNKENECLYYGKIEGINDLVTYEGLTEFECRVAFISAVNDYIETLKELKKK